MRINVTFDSKEQRFSAGFEDAEKRFSANFGDVTVVTAGAEEYAGSYEVTPKVESQILPTEDRIMKQNLTVKEIPYYAVSNNFGQTIVIGGN